MMGIAAVLNSLKGTGLRRVKVPGSSPDADKTRKVLWQQGEIPGNNRQDANMGRNANSW